ncbi:hypothetical protein BDV93DRAFT_560127 [Ceratobasidium sp. AG-I]|nr:hypothetical protein BDV93DRAFT_560127 [Ceratobasidium sp. AG-I]
MSGQLKISKGESSYNSAKASDTHMTKMLATEFALKSVPVRMNSIAPGNVTELTCKVIRPR